VTGWQTRQLIEAFPWLSFAEAVRSLPAMLNTPAGVTVYLKHMEELGAARRRRQAELRKVHAPPRPVIWQQDDYRLVELTHPAHYVQESHVLGHCVGTSYNTRAINRMTGRCKAPASEQYLSYWLRREWRQSRMFSFEVDDTPKFTIEVNLRRRALQHIQGRHSEKPTDPIAPFWPYLCRAIAALQRETRFVRTLADLLLDNDTVLLPDGSIEPAELDNLADAVMGSVTAKTLGHPRAFARALALPALDLNLTGVPETYLRDVEVIQSTVMFTGHNLTMPKLRRIEGHCYLYPVQSAKLPQLQRVVGDVYGAALDDISLPKLRAIAGSFISEASILNLPELLSVGGNFAHSRLKGGNLQKLRYIYGPLDFGAFPRDQLPKFKRGYHRLRAFVQPL
jgi:hypothetical protein